MKTIGVLGGMGPQATMDFEQRVHAVAQRLIPQQANQGYPPMVVYYHRTSPVVMQANDMPVFPLQPDPGLLDAARRLGAWADFLVITSNGVHLFQAAVEQAAGRPVLSMIEATMRDVRQRAAEHVGVLAFQNPLIYQLPLEQAGLTWTSVPPALQDRLNHLVFAVSAGQAGADDHAAIREAVAFLRAAGTDANILGCTEFPLLLADELAAPDLINPAQLLADAAVRYAIE